MAKLIEIVGPPGSGKSFLSSKLRSLKIDKNKIFFHSEYNEKFKTNKNLNLITKIIIRTKVILTIFFFHLLFFNRIFSKKIYKRNFFFRSILLFYRDLISIEFLKKKIPNDCYLITEPGLIMHFVQDYFYIKKTIPKNHIKIFNNLFLKIDYIIWLDCNIQSLLKRLSLRKRGLPQRMRELNVSEIHKTIKKSNTEIGNYLKKSNILKSKIIKINNENNIEVSVNKLLNFLNIS
jgi:adenylate kinase family enzyme